MVVGKVALAVLVDLEVEAAEHRVIQRELPELLILAGVVVEVDIQESQEDKDLPAVLA